MNFQILHRYNRAASDGLVDNITCPEDGSTLGSMMVDKDAEEPQVMLHCYTCSVNIIPGILFFDQLEAALNDLESQQ